MTAPPFPTGTDGLPVNMNQADSTFGVRQVGMPRPALVLPLLEMSDSEQEMFDRLQSQVLSKRFQLELRDAYYRGTVQIQDLGISIPPSMRSLHTAIGWPRVAVESLAMRLTVDGFLYPDSSDVDDRLQQIWVGNDMDSEHGLALLDALVFGAGYVALGKDDDGDTLITVESPLDVAVQWDARRRRMEAALRLYGTEGEKLATLYLPEQTISLESTAGGWTVTGRDHHSLGKVPWERIANRSRSYSRDGASEITPELMSITDQGCRTLLGLAVAGEFYSGPQRYILGASQSAFQDATGAPKSAWETYLGRVLALERDEDGNVPSVGQFTAYDPSVFTKVIDSLAQRVSALTGLPPHALGFATANPTSADAIRSAEMELTRRADHKTVQFGKSWRNVMKLALLMDGESPPNADQIATVWASTATPTIAATTDALFKQTTMGYLPATSDVVGEALGYTAAQRRRIEADRKTDAGTSFLNQVAHSLTEKAARADQGLAKDIGGPQVGTDGIPAP